MKVFVYGTLKQGFSNHHWMLEAGGKLICEASLFGFEMYSLGAFPAAVPGIGRIEGEVYEVEDISILDTLEGYPHFYNRTLAETQEGLAWVYFLERNQISKQHIIPNGRWL